VGVRGQPRSSREQTGDFGHREEQSSAGPDEGDEAITTIELCRPLVLGIDDEGIGSDLVAKRSAECVEEQKLAMAPPWWRASTARRPISVASTIGYRGSCFANDSGKSARAKPEEARV
jgi:hypothetical protein